MAKMVAGGRPVDPAASQELVRRKASFLSVCLSACLSPCLVIRLTILTTPSEAHQLFTDKAICPAQRLVGPA